MGQPPAGGQTRPPAKPAAARLPAGGCDDHRAVQQKSTNNRRNRHRPSRAHGDRNGAEWHVPETSPDCRGSAPGSAASLSNPAVRPYAARHYKKTGDANLSRVARPINRFSFDYRQIPFILKIGFQPNLLLFKFFKDSVLRHFAVAGPTVPEPMEAAIRISGRTTYYVYLQFSWWAVTGSNRRPTGCKPVALPAELTARRFDRNRPPGTAPAPLHRNARRPGSGPAMAHQGLAANRTENGRPCRSGHNPRQAARRAARGS